MTHRAPVVPAGLTPEMAAFLSMGGSIEDLCGPGSEQATTVNDCEACRIQGSALPGPAYRPAPNGLPPSPCASCAAGRWTLRR